MLNKIKSIFNWGYQKYLNHYRNKFEKKLYSYDDLILREHDYKEYNPFTILEFYLIGLVIFMLTGMIIMGIIIICN